MKKHAILATILFVTIAFCALTVFAKAEETTLAKIWTDKPDYSPEDTVTIFGTGFLPESLVTVEVTRPDLTVDSWNVTSSLDGSFTTTYLLDGIMGTYTVKATDGINTATTTFTDDLSAIAVYPTGASAGVYTPPEPSEKNSFLTTDDVYAAVTIANTGSGSYSGRLYVVDHIPANGENLDSPSKDVSGGYESISPNQKGKNFVYLVWSHSSATPPVEGTYYIVCDGGNGQYGGGDLISGSFTVVAQYLLTVTASPVGALGGSFRATYTVGGVTQTNELHVTEWTQWVDAGSSVTLSSAQDPITVGSTKYVFASYSESFPYTMNAAHTITLNYNTEYLLTVTASPTGAKGGSFKATYTLGGTTYTDEVHLTEWTQWIDSGTGVTLSSAQDPITVGSTKYVFASYSETFPYTVNSAHTITLNYNTQYLLTVTASPGGAKGGSFTATYTVGGSLKTDEVHVTEWTQWVDALSDVTIGNAQDPIIVGSTKYVFNSYSPAATIDDIAAPSTITLTYDVQYLLTVTASPSGAIGGSFKATYTKDGSLRSSELHTTDWTEWVDAGTDVTLSNAQVEIIVGSTRYVFDSYSESFPYSMGAPATITLNYDTTYLLTVTASPAGAIGGSFKATYTKDGITYTDEVHVTDWTQWVDASSSVTLSNAQDPIIVGGTTKYVFASYSESFPYTMNSAHTITLNYNTQYLLTVTADPAGAIGGSFRATYTLGGTPHLNELHTTDWTEWVDAGSDVTLGSAQDPIIVGSTKYVFNSYSPSASIDDIAAASTITLTYDVQYLLTVTASPTGAKGGSFTATYTVGGSTKTDELHVTEWTQWVDAGTGVTLSNAQTPITVGSTRYVFASYSESFPYTMSSAHTITLNYNTQYLLTVTASPAGAIGGSFRATYTLGGSAHTNELHLTDWTEWVDAGSDVAISAAQVEIIKGTTRYVFDSYDPSASIDDIAAASAITLKYDTTYLLTVTASPAGAIGGSFKATYIRDGTTYTDEVHVTEWTQWVDAGTGVTLTNAQEEIIDGLTRYVFDSYSESFPYTMNSAHTITLTYDTQYLLTVTVDPSGAIGGSFRATYTLGGSLHTNELHVTDWTQWVDDGTGVTLTNAQVEIIKGSTRYVFDDYSESFPYTMGSPATITLYYDTTYLLTVTADPSGAKGGSFRATYYKDGSLHSSELHTTDWTEWVDDGTGVTLTNAQIEIIKGTTRYVFDSYSEVFPYTMGSPATITLNYDTTYLLTVTASPTGAKGGSFKATYDRDGTHYADEVHVTDWTQWVDAGTDVVLSAAQVEIIKGSTRYVFDSYSDTFPYIMSSAHTVTLYYDTTYLLTVTASPPGAIGGSFKATYTKDGTTYIDEVHLTEWTQWVDSGTTATLTAAKFILVSGTQYIFDHWSGGVTVSTNPTTASMTAPKTAIANYVVLPFSDVTSSSLCPITQFKLLFIQDMQNPNTYKLTASNPGQFYYNVFYIGTAGASYSFDITIPGPFVTQGAMPVHIYGDVSLSGGCYVPANLQGVLDTQITGDAGGTIHVEGIVPASGLVYVTVHLDYGLKGTANYKPDASLNALDAGDTTLPYTVLIENLESYTFSYSGHDTTVKNVNDFKKVPGFGGIVTDDDGDPVEGVIVEITIQGVKYTATTNEDGFYLINYKTGKAQTYSAVFKYNGYTSTAQTGTIKANKFIVLNHELPFDVP